MRVILQFWKSENQFYKKRMFKGRFRNFPLSILPDSMCHLMKEV